MLDIAPAAIGLTAPVVAADEHRSPRVRFVHPVVVTALHDGRSERLESRNLSTHGMFLEMGSGWGRGTRVSIALEAGGHAWPFAEGEVVWHREYSNSSLARRAGVGIRFTRYLHPRARELVRYVCDAVAKGWRLQTAPQRTPVRAQLVAASLAAVGAPLLAALVWFLCGRATPIGEFDRRALAAGVSVTAPPVETHEAPSATTEAAATVAPQTASTPVVSAAAEVALNGPDSAEDELAPLAAPPPLPPADEHRVAFSSGAATAVTWQAARDEFRIAPELAHGAKVSKVYLLADPPRLVFDIDGAEPAVTQSRASGERRFARIRVGRQHAATRLVVDLANEPRSFFDEDGSAAIVSF